MKIGILGGAFDPIHNGHLALAEAALHKLRLDFIYFVPSFIPPFASEKKCQAATELRLAMVQAAILNIPKMRVSDLELQRKGVSYTIDTVREFRKEYPPPEELFFIAGADCANSLERWKSLDEILSLSHFVIGSRSQIESENDSKKLKFISFNPIPISSTQIRELIKKGEPVTQWIPKPVLEIIQKHKLYTQ